MVPCYSNVCVNQKVLYYSHEHTKDEALCYCHMCVQQKVL